MLNDWIGWWRGRGLNHLVLERHGSCNINVWFLLFLSRYNTRASKMIDDNACDSLAIRTRDGTRCNHTPNPFRLILTLPYALALVAPNEGMHLCAFYYYYYFFYYFYCHVVKQK